MTTSSFSSRVRHDDDATYREWRDEFITAMAALVAGGHLAADETNITPGAGSRPGTGTEQGYAVYHINDSLHGTAPVYLRFGFGTHTGSTSPRIQVTHGTSTNGSGVLGGTALSTIQSIHSSSAQTTDTARQSYFCSLPGFLGINWKLGASTSEGGFFFCRSCDADGVPTVTGGMIHCGQGQSGEYAKRQSFRYAAAAAAYTAHFSSEGAGPGMLGFLPQALSTTQVGSDIQVALGWMVTPRVQPLFGICGVLDSELNVGGTFSVALVGASARTFITVGRPFGGFGPIAPGVNGGLTCAMLWE